MNDIRRRAHFPAGRFGRFVTLLTAAVLVGAMPQPLAAQAEDPELAAARQRLDALYDPLAALHAATDRSPFDPQALAMDLAFEDATTIVQHVNEVVRFEPYRGVLRGAEGTLVSGGGNALDQALLTSTLLFDAGYETEIRGATLTGEQVALLLAQVRPSVARTFDGHLNLADMGLPLDTRQVMAAAEAEVASLRADVSRADALLAGVATDAGGGGSLIEAAAQEYHWVAYRLSASQPWSEAHPVFGTDVPPQFAGLEATQTYQSELPAELQHRFRFQVFIERRLGDELVVVPVTEAWERPVANMYGAALSYANVPDGLEGLQAGGGPDALMTGTSFFYPMFNGDLAPGGQAFDMLGSVVPPDAAASPFAGVFQSVSGALAGGIGALSSIGFGADEAEPDGEAVALTAQWFEFTFIAPGEEPVTHRRMVVDRLGAEARAAGSVRLDPTVPAEVAFAALASVHTFMLEPGRYADDYVTDRSLEAALALREYVDMALMCALEGVSPPELPFDLTTAETALAPLALFAAFGDAPLDAELVSYRPAPAMVLLSQRVDGTGTQVDVVTNPRWTLRADANGVSFDSDANRLAGVWETRAEALPLAASGAAVVPSFQALSAAASSGDLLVIGADQPDVALGLELPYEARMAMTTDLAAGYSVIVPSRQAPASLAEVGWWRVDPLTGETLGRGGDGRGSAFVDYLTSLELSWTISAGVTVVGVHQCTKMEDPAMAGCCILQNVALGGAGVAVGTGMAVMKGAAGALTRFAILDVGANTAGFFLPTVCEYFG